MPPVEPVLPSTVTECARIAHALAHGANIRAGDVYIVMSKRPPLHTVYDITTTLARGRAMYDAAEEPRPGWTATDANNRQLYGPIKAPARAPRPTTSDSNDDSQDMEFMIAPAVGHTCWTGGVSLTADVTDSGLRDVPCGAIMGGTVSLNVSTAAGDYTINYTLPPGTDAVFLTSGSIEEFLIQPYQQYYGVAYATALRRRLGT